MAAENGLIRKSVDFRHVLLALDPCQSGLTLSHGGPQEQWLRKQQPAGDHPGAGRWVFVYK
ncbi:MAG: hypothetical protein HUU41_19425 [Bryobacteraceae bacterium]|nr:hypothetical protein [Bryobacterales bacterium]NUN03282.1 hypothetical protein [Bryobacteraceae bacterium]